MSKPRKKTKRPAKRSPKRSANGSRSLAGIGLKRHVTELTRRLSLLTSSLGHRKRKASALQTILSEVTTQREEIRIQNDQLNESQLLLEESRDRYANLYDFAPVACLTLCEHGIIREINLTGSSLLGHWRARLLERPLLQFVDRADRPAFLEHLRRCRDGQPSVTTELQMCDAGGRIFPAELTSIRAASDEIDIAQFRSVILDLTERKRADIERRRLDATQQSERLLKTVVEALPLGVRVLDADGNVLLFNDASDAIWGRPMRSLAQWAEIGARSVQTGDALNSIAHWPAWFALKKGQTILNELIELPRPRSKSDGPTPAESSVPEGVADSRFISESAVPLRDESNAIMGAVLVSEDVTRQLLAQRRLRNAKESAETANRLKDEFLAIASHELRTPISSVLLWIHLLRDSIDDPAQRHEALDMVEQSARAQAHLINDLLDVARLETGKLELQVAAKELRPAIQAIVDSIRPTARTSGVELTTDLGDAPIFAMIDTDRLRQILLNVLGNALKFTPAGGHVTVTLHAAEGQARIEVNDTGKGISPEFLPFIFERFRQGDVTMTRKHGGMGLGLTISRQLAEMHGGKLTGHSQGPGKGSTFTLTLPQAEPGKHAVSKRPHAIIAKPPRPAPALAALATTSEKPARINGPPTHALSGMRVLLVEDEVSTRTALTRVLRDSGARVTAASTAAEACAAFERAKAHPPDVLLSDITMPDMDGYALLGEIRTVEAARNGSSKQPPIPAVALTARTTVEDALRATQAGFAIHLPKPVEPQRLIKILLDVTARPS